MPEITRRSAVAGAGATIMTALAGCSSSDAGTSSAETGSEDREFEYVQRTQETVIGDGTEVQPAVMITLTDFAVSRHSAASKILIQSSGESVGNSSIVDSNSLTIPVTENNHDLIVVVDDNNNTLTEYKI